MSLVGKYENPNTHETLDITEANDSNGSLKGSLVLSASGPEIRVPVEGHYHFFQSTGSETSIVFMALRDGGPQLYEAWAGVGTGPSYKELNMFGGRGLSETSTSGKAEALKGPWRRIA